jgi:hypothetical protein
MAFKTKSVIKITNKKNGPAQCARSVIERYLSWKNVSRNRPLFGVAFLENEEALAYNAPLLRMLRPATSRRGSGNKV